MGQDHCSGRNGYINMLYVTVHYLSITDICWLYIARCSEYWGNRTFGLHGICTACGGDYGMVGEKRN